MRGGPAIVPRDVALPAIVIAATVAVVSGSSRSTLSRFEFSQPHMGTTVRVVLYTETDTNARTLGDRAFARIAELDSRLSDYRSDSEVMALSRAAGGPPQAVSHDLYTVLSAAQRLARASDGAFDVTVGPLSRLWRRARVTGEPPSAEAIAAARALVGCQYLELHAGRARLARAGMRLDLGGIAKGYAAREALRALREGGAARALVAVGGDIAAGDGPPGRNGWTVAVAPLGPNAETRIRPLVIQHEAVSTSGDAEQYVEHEGTRYSHILTPRTGRAVEGRRGVTVRADDAMLADALATTVSVLGTEAGLALVDTAGAAALILERAQHEVREFRSRRWSAMPAISAPDGGR